MIDVIGAPKRSKFSEQIGLFIIVLGRAQPIHRIRRGLFTNFQHLVADFIDSGVPVKTLPFAIYQFHGVLQPSLAMAMFAKGCALGTMRPHIDRRIPVWLLSSPDTVLYFGDDPTTDRAMSTYRVHQLGGYAFLCIAVGGPCLLQHAGARGHGQSSTTCSDTGIAQKGAPINRHSQQTVGSGRHIRAVC